MHAQLIEGGKKQQLSEIQLLDLKEEYNQVTPDEISAKDTLKDEIRIKLFQEERSQTKRLRLPKHQTCSHKCHQ